MISPKIAPYKSMHLISISNIKASFNQPCCLNFLFYILCRHWQLFWENGKNAISIIIHRNAFCSPFSYLIACHIDRINTDYFLSCGRGHQLSILSRIKNCHSLKLFSYFIFVRQVIVCGKVGVQMLLLDNFQNTIDDVINYIETNYDVRPV